MANPVIFSAVKTGGSELKSGDYLHSYTKFLTNAGDTFDLQTGVFKAPKRGIYEFGQSSYFRSYRYI